MAIALEHDFTRESLEYIEPVNAPRLLWLFGEKGQYSIRLVVLNELTIANEYHRVQRLFPEAMIKLVSPQFWPDESPTSPMGGTSWRTSGTPLRTSP
ncbi:MAG TPA: hypothetical protein VGG64_11465 [Pirellulales bacterium]